MKGISFPLDVQCGSTTVKLYLVEKDRPKYMVSHYHNTKRKLRMFAEFEKAHAHAKATAKTLARGEMDVLELRSKDRLSYIHAIDALRPTGASLELAAKEYAEALDDFIE